MQKHNIIATTLEGNEVNLIVDKYAYEMRIHFDEEGNEIVVFVISNTMIFRCSPEQWKIIKL